MKFVSTRSSEKVTGTDVILKSVSANGGLFVPEKFPTVSEEEMDAMLEMSYAERAAKILSKFFPELAKEILSACESAYSSFGADDVAPLVRLDDGVYMLELFHGPSCSYKDMSAFVLKNILKVVAAEKKKIVVSSSAESGKSAMEAFKNEDGFSALAFYSNESLAKMQKIQLGIQEGGNVLSEAVKGTPDACASAVRDALASSDIKTSVQEASAELIYFSSQNFGVTALQTAYFFSAYADLLSSEQIEKGEEIDFVIPCGNLGNAISAFYARKMGLPIRKIRCASNENSSLAEFLKTGRYTLAQELVRTTSPALDALFAHNCERLIYEVSGRDSKLTAKRMTQLKEEGNFSVTETEFKAIAEIFDAGSASEEDCVEAMYDVFVDTGYTMDTQTGCAMKVAVDFFEKNKKDETKAVIVATANPYKFPQDVLYAVTGNDVKDSFKGIKRLHAATAMAVPKCLKELRDKLPRFTKIIDKKKVPEEILNFIK